MTEKNHPFETVSLKRISQAHPRFLEKINYSKVRRDIEMSRARKSFRDQP